MQYCHASRCTLVEVLAQAVLEQPHFYQVFAFGNADAFTEGAHGLRRVAASSQTRDCRHAGIVPAIDVVFGYELAQTTFAQYGVCQIQPGELSLFRVIDPQRFEIPVV